MPAPEMSPKETTPGLETAKTKDDLVKEIMESWKQLEDLVVAKEAELGRPLTSEESAAYNVTLRYGNKQGNQWFVTANPREYSIENPSLNEGFPQYYGVEAGPYKNPIIEMEPHLAFPVPAELNYVNAKGEKIEPRYKIGGVIIDTDEDLGDLRSRTSLTPLYEGEEENEDGEKKPKLKAIPNSEGIEYGGRQWYLAGLIEKDKNRFINYDAIYRAEKADQVKVVELEEIKL
jgi:hypothetical protein